MPVVPIVTGADQSVLRTKTQAVEHFDKELKQMVQDLLDTVEDAEGAGLAAPQIGLRSRVCVARIGNTMTPLVNPEIVWQSEQVNSAEEGCLSLPGVWLHITRPIEVVLHYIDLKGNKQERKLEGWDARVVQHEVDHLNGVLITDYQAKKSKESKEGL